MPRRKTRKIERFNQLANCFELDEFSLAELPATAELVLEAGCGDGHFTYELAKLYPKKIVIGIDLKAYRLGQGGRRAVADQLKNVFFVRANIEDFAEAFPALPVSQLWVTFPDPYPKNRHAKRRLNHPRFIDIYEGWLGADGELLIKTDDPAFFIEAVENLEAKQWEILELTDDLNGEHPGRFPLTTFEREFVENGIPIFFLRAQKSFILAA